jgi:20S proteasome alpha/beta subunit
VTICIAALCEHRESGSKALVLCSDWRVSGHLGRADTMHKQPGLPKDFACLVAGDPPETASVVRTMRKKFTEAGDVDETNLTRLVKEALFERRAERRDALAQARFGLTHDEVIKRGKDYLPQEHFIRYLNDSASIRLDSEFIVAGFSPGDSFIVETTKSCDVTIVENFACIGAGEFLARASLLHREIDTITSFDRALYYVYEAKKAAERVTSVGESTLITVLEHDGKSRRVAFDKYDRLDALYMEYGPRKVPRNLEIPADLLEDRGR